MNTLKIDDIIRYKCIGNSYCGLVLDVDDEVVVVKTNIPRVNQGNHIPLVASYEIDAHDITDIEVMVEDWEQEEVFEELMMVELDHIKTLVTDLLKRYPHASLDDMCHWLNS